MLKKLILIVSFFMLQSLYAFPIKTIRFATEATYPPFEYIDSTGTIKGFDIDIANALCVQLRAQCSFTNQSFASLIPSLQLRKFDALISSIGITAERQREVAFTQPYYQPSAAFVAALIKNYALSDMIGGVTIGVQQGSTFETYLRDNYRETVTIKTYASIQEAFLDLVSGRVDAVLADTPIVKAWLQENDNRKKYGIIDKPIQDAKYFGAGYGIAVNKKDIGLLNVLNTAIDQIKKNGTYDKIVKKYF